MARPFADPEVQAMSLLTNALRDVSDLDMAAQERIYEWLVQRARPNPALLAALTAVTKEMVGLRRAIVAHKKSRGESATPEDETLYRVASLLSEATHDVGWMPDEAERRALASR